MFSFLRKRKPSLPMPLPLRASDWDGRTLTLTEPACADGEIALDVDGVFFSSATADAMGRVHFDFAFAPARDDRLALQARRGRGGAPLGGSALSVRHGTPGVLQAPPASPTPVASSPMRTTSNETDIDLSLIDVVIVVPVYNAPELVRRCLDSVLVHTTGRARLIVIDDASPDPAIAPLLEDYCALSSVNLVSHARNRGFTATANHGIALAGGADVVLLNADAEVGPNWLAGLCRAAYSDATIGSATAVSDNAGAFSVPELERENRLPDAWTFEQCARGVWQHAGLDYPALPTGNGFCLYLRRSMLDRVGALDEAAFAQGYGEENDLCQRAAAVGFRHVIAGNVLIRHARSQSFGEERRIALGRAGMAVLRERWPNYEADVAATLFSFERRVLDWRVRRLFAAAAVANAPRPRVLVHAGEGAPSDGFETWRLREGRSGIEITDGFDRPVACADEIDTRSVLRNWLQAHAIEAVVSAAADPQDALAAAARSLGIAIAPSPTRVAEALATARSFPMDAR